jgi:cyclopropane-fatty-acyl-phospholipid synthase
MNTHIFPGGCLPSLEAIARGVAGRTDMQIVGLEDLTPHYVETLRRWRRRFAEHAGQLAELGYDERFQRLWTLYLCYCEAGFAERRILDLQILLGKPRHRIDAPVTVAAAAPAGAAGVDASEAGHSGAAGVEAAEAGHSGAAGAGHSGAVAARS